MAAGTETTTSATELVESFLTLLADGEADAAADMLAPDVVYTNVSLPSIRGRERVRGLARSVVARGLRFEYVTHNTSEKDGVVLNERTDALMLGPLRVQFWVYGRFEVSGGQIAVWRDSFDWLDITVGLVRGIVGIAVPAAGRRLPAG